MESAPEGAPETPRRATPTALTEGETAQLLGQSATVGQLAGEMPEIPAETATAAPPSAPLPPVTLAEVDANRDTLEAIQPGLYEAARGDVMRRDHLEAQEKLLPDLIPEWKDAARRANETPKI